MTINNVPNIPVEVDPRPLRYIVEALRQIVETVRDFGLDDAAQMLDRARLDIEQNLPRQRSDHEIR
jgi:hypothetical protein